MPFLYGGGGLPLVRTAMLSTLSSGCSNAAPATPGLVHSICHLYFPLKISIFKIELEQRKFEVRDVEKWVI